MIDVTCDSIKDEPPSVIVNAFDFDVVFEEVRDASENKVHLE